MPYMADRNQGVNAPIRADRIRIAIQMNALLSGRGSFRRLDLATLLKPGRGLTVWEVMLDTGMLRGVLETAIVILPFFVAIYLWQPLLRAGP